jgi:hypothetical protein
MSVKLERCRAAIGLRALRDEAAAQTLRDGKILP